MSSETPKHNHECKSDNHVNHLCFLESQGLRENNPEEYENLTGQPKFQCHYCGRTAGSADNVCMPIEL